MMQMIFRGPSRLVALALLLVTTACTVGPDYTGPPQVGSAGADGAAFQRTGDLPVGEARPVGRWWESLDDPVLNGLVDRALSSSPSIAIAEARLRQARARLSEQERNRLPNGNLSAVYAHTRLPGGSLGVSGDGEADQGESEGSPEAISGDFYNLGFDASWEIDLFGRAGRAAEAVRRQAEASEAELADAQVSLTAEVAQAYVNLRDRQQRLTLGQRAAALQSRMLDLTVQRQQAGTASALDVERLRTALERTQADLLPLQGQIEESLDQLAMLVGREPGALDKELSGPAALPLPPEQVAVGDPADLLRRRPDIRAAERQLAAATAQIGVNVAQLFPSVSLLGIVGLGGPDLGDVVDPDSYTLIAAPMLRWNFLNFGRIRAKIRQSEAARDEALAQYQSTVLQALRNAEGALSRFRYQRANVEKLARVDASARRAATLMQQREAQGTASLIDYLDTERQRLAAEQELSQGRAALTNDFVSLQKSLGLGWGATAVATPGGA